jgi:hypothetical protein
MLVSVIYGVVLEDALTPTLGSTIILISRHAFCSSIVHHATDASQVRIVIVMSTLQNNRQRNPL